MENSLYVSWVGSIIYVMVCCRLDIAYSINIKLVYGKCEFGTLGRFGKKIKK